MGIGGENVPCDFHLVFTASEAFSNHPEIHIVRRSPTDGEILLAQETLRVVQGQISPLPNIPVNAAGRVPV